MKLTTAEAVIYARLCAKLAAPEPTPAAKPAPKPAAKKKATTPKKPRRASAKKSA